MILGGSSPAGLEAVFSACVPDQVHGHLPGCGHVSGAIFAAQTYLGIVEHHVDDMAMALRPGKRGHAGARRSPLSEGKP